MQVSALEGLYEIIDVLQSRDIRISNIEMTEYIRGDPTVGEHTVTGAEIEITAYISLDEWEDDDENSFRVK